MTVLRVEVGAKRLEHALGGECRVAAVVDQDDVGRRAGREVGAQALAIVALVGDVDQADVDLRLLGLERRDEALVGRLLGRIAEDHERDRVRRRISAAAKARSPAKAMQASLTDRTSFSA